MKRFFTSDLLKTVFGLALGICLGSTALAQDGGAGSGAGKIQAAGLSLGIRSGGQAKAGAAFSRPGNSQDYVMQPGGSWVLESNSVYTYNGDGRLTQRLYLHPSTAANLSRNLIVYDPQGDETSNTTENWVNNNWEVVEGYKALITYNPGGKRTETIYQDWDNALDIWVNSNREQITYDATGQVTEIVNSEWMASQWELTDRMLITNPSGVGSHILFQTHDGSTWMDDSRATNVSWHVLYETPSAYTMQVYDNNNWVNYEKYSAVYDSNGGHVGLFQSWDFAGNAWRNSFRETESFDQNLNYIGWLNEGWNQSSSSWSRLAENQEVLTYSGIDVLERLFRDNNNQSALMADRNKEVYSNFQLFGVTGMQDELAGAAINVFPNPANAFVRVSLPSLSGDLTASLTDVTGKHLVTKQFKDAVAFDLSLENLPKGIYLLKLHNGNATAIRKVVKE